MLCGMIIGLIQGKCNNRGSENFEYKQSNLYHCLSCINFTATTREIHRFVCDSSENNNQYFCYTYHRVSQYYGNDRPYSMKLIFSARSTGKIELVEAEPDVECPDDNLWKLDYSENNISKIYPGYFHMIQHLKEMNLANNLLTTIDGDMFALMPELQTLNMSRNSISIVHESSFIHLLDLFTVDLSFNTITYLPENLFNYQNHLELIVLNNNQIKHFSVNLHIHVVPPSVDLSFNILNTFDIPYNFKNISLSSNKLTYFTLPITESVMAINLSHNSIKTLNGSLFVNAQNLRILDVSHNLLSSMPTSSLKNAKKLEYMDISHNLFYKTTYGVDDNWVSFFLNLEFLKTVNLAGNSWSCSDLKDIMHSLTSQGVKIVQGNKHDDDNMLGINCRDMANNKSDKVKFDPFESVQMLVDQRISQEINESRSKIASISSKVEEITNQLNKLMLQEDLTKATNSEERDNILTDHFAAVLDDKISKLQVPKQEKNYVEAQKMEKVLTDQSTGNTGSIITNILLIVLVCGLGFLIYTTLYKGKRMSSSSVRENINLV